MKTHTISEANIQKIQNAVWDIINDLNIEWPEGYGAPVGDERLTEPLVEILCVCRETTHGTSERETVEP